MQTTHTNNLMCMYASVWVCTDKLVAVFIVKCNKAKVNKVKEKKKNTYKALIFLKNKFFYAFQAEGKICREREKKWLCWYKNVSKIAHGKK